MLDTDSSRQESLAQVFVFLNPDAAPMSAGLNTCICTCLTCKCLKPKLQFESTAYQVQYQPRGAAGKTNIFTGSLRISQSFK